MNGGRRGESTAEHEEEEEEEEDEPPLEIEPVARSCPSRSPDCGGSFISNSEIQ